jgi:pantoate--beta-alanine ligase
MKIIYTINEISQIIKNIKSQNKTIGFVPTMGFLHNGHSSLFDKSVGQSDITIISIFVNPTQFGLNEDYNKYPRDLEHDTKIAEQHNVDYVFAPDVLEIYPIGFLTNIGINKLTNVFEGKLRPGHFEGVALILIKLFNIIKPDYVFFGQKDYQQTLVVKQIVRDLNIDTKIVVSPTVRLDTGLAMSSRNSYLSVDEFEGANILYQAMEVAKTAIMNGERNRKNINTIMHQVLRTNKNIRIDYASIAMADDLSELNIFYAGDKAILLVAVYLGKTRLIDNSLITFPHL